MAEEYGIITIKGERGGTVAEIQNYLSSIESAYSNLYAFDLFVDRARQTVFGNEYLDNEPRPAIQNEPQPVARIEYLRAASVGTAPALGSRALRALKPLKNLEGLVLPDDKLRLRSVVIQSPGFWEFLGALNPLETLRKYVNDRHEQRKDREYKEPLERGTTSFEK